MKTCILFIAAFIAFAIPAAYAEKGAYLDGVDFVQYLDENTALEEIAAGNLDTYYFRIPAERLEDPSYRENLQVFESPGGFYSILVNPAESDTFNPFNRKLVVNEHYGIKDRCLNDGIDGLRSGSNTSHWNVDFYQRESSWNSSTKIIY